MSVVKLRRTLWLSNRTARIEVSRLAGQRVHVEIMTAAEPGALKIGILFDLADARILEEALAAAREAAE